MHLHSHHRLQHRHPSKQQQQQEGAADKTQAVPLGSLDDFMDQELQQQQQQQQQVSKLPTPHTSLSVPDGSQPTAAGAAAGSSTTAGAGPIEAAAPAAWAAEQSSRWAQTRGEAAQPSPTAEVQQRLDDSAKLFGSSAASRRGKAGSSGAGGKQQGGDAGQRQPQQQQQQQQGGSSSGGGGQGSKAPAKASAGPASSQSKYIPVTFAGEGTSQEGSKSSKGSSSGTSASKRSGSTASEQFKPSQEAQRSAAEAADALAALMAEIEGEDVAESDQEEVLKELGLTGDDASLAEARVQAAELQEAADMVQQATQQLDNLQKQQDDKTAAAAAAAAGQEASSKGKGKQKQHKQHAKQQQQQEPQPTGSSSRILPKQPQQQQRPPLGSSGDAAFVAAAKALKGSKKPSRTVLLGCLEAIEQQQEQLRTQLAKKALQQAVAGAAQQQAAAQDPAARKLQQLQADFARACDRAEQEKNGIRAAASADVLGRLLPLLDSFEAAEAALDKQQQQAGAAGSDREYEEARRVYNALHAQLLSIVK
jgi:molecular chaperone GrpE (heat shock protein)